MRHNAVMGVIAIASCVAVVSSTMVGPMTRLRHHTSKMYSHNRRILTGVVTGYIGGDSEVATVVAPLSSPRAQLLLADFAEKADDTSGEPSPSSPPPGPSFEFSPGSGTGGSGPGGAAPGVSSPATPAATPPIPPPSPFLPGTPAAPSLVTGGLVTPPAPVTTPSPPPPPPPPPVTPVEPPVTPDPPPVVIPVVEPIVVSPPPSPITEPSPPPPAPPVSPPPPPVITPVRAVPEPATWISMLAGFALAGGALRRRRLAVSLSSRR